MRLTSLAFLIVLAVAHCPGESAEELSLPLSTFRDGPYRPYGILLFLLLLLIAGQMLRSLHRAGRDGSACFLGLVALFLLLVALTPSENGFHLFCSLVVLVLLYVYYAAMLSEISLVCLGGHLLVPLLLVGLTQFHSYGLWQKGLIVYFLVAANVQHAFLSPGWPRSRKRVSARRQMESGPSRRRVVYVVGPGKDWARKRTADSTSGLHF
jgi:hypothetical protein